MLDLYFNWTNVVQNFSETFETTFATSKKAHFDSVPSHLRVIDGARSRWSNLLLLDSIIYILDYKEYNLASRRAFNQQQVLHDSIISELFRCNPQFDDARKHENLLVGIKPVISSPFLHGCKRLSPSDVLIMVENQTGIWQDATVLRNHFLSDPTAKSRDKYLSIVDVLFSHPALLRYNLNLPEIFQNAILKVLFEFCPNSSIYNSSLYAKNNKNVNNVKTCSNESKSKCISKLKPLETPPVDSEDDLFSCLSSSTATFSFTISSSSDSYHLNSPLITPSSYNNNVTTLTMFDCNINTDTNEVSNTSYSDDFSSDGFFQDLTYSSSQYELEHEHHSDLMNNCMANDNASSAAILMQYPLASNKVTAMNDSVATLSAASSSSSSSLNKRTLPMQQRHMCSSSAAAMGITGLQVNDSSRLLSIQHSHQQHHEASVPVKSTAPLIVAAGTLLNNEKHGYTTSGDVSIAGASISTTTDIITVPYLRCEMNISDYAFDPAVFDNDDEAEAVDRCLLGNIVNDDNDDYDNNDDGDSEEDCIMKYKDMDCCLAVCMNKDERTSIQHSEYQDDDVDSLLFYLPSTTTTAAAAAILTPKSQYLIKKQQQPHQCIHSTASSAVMEAWEFLSDDDDDDDSSLPGNHNSTTAVAGNENNCYNWATDRHAASKEYDSVVMTFANNNNNPATNFDAVDTHNIAIDNLATTDTVDGSIYSNPITTSSNSPLRLNDCHTNILCDKDSKDAATATPSGNSKDQTVLFEPIYLPFQLGSVDSHHHSSWHRHRILSGESNNNNNNNSSTYRHCYKDREVEGSGGGGVISYYDDDVNNNNDDDDDEDSIDNNIHSRSRQLFTSTPPQSLPLPAATMTATCSSALPIPLQTSFYSRRRTFGSYDSADSNSSFYSDSTCGGGSSNNENISSSNRNNRSRNKSVTKKILRTITDSAATARRTTRSSSMDNNTIHLVQPRPWRRARGNSCGNSSSCCLGSFSIDSCDSDNSSCHSINVAASAWSFTDRNSSDQCDDHLTSCTLLASPPPSAKTTVPPKLQSSPPFITTIIASKRSFRMSRESDSNSSNYNNCSSKCDAAYY